MIRSAGGEREAVEVTVVVHGGEELVAGTLWSHGGGGQSSTFRYDDAFLAHPLSYDLDPSLPLSAGLIQTAVGKSMFNAFSDSAPDRWGQNLMRRSERDRATSAGSTPRRLTVADFLLGTHDELRQGAIRFRRPGTANYWTTAPHSVPKLISLGALLASSDRYSAGGADVSDLVDAGSSLGGARPKAAVRTGTGRLAIAKFPRKGSDEWDVPGWEKLEADLASMSGIDIAPAHLVKVLGRNVLLSERFDRLGDVRIGYASALTMLEASDGDYRSYLEMADAIQTSSDGPRRDLAQLYRRIVFSVLTGNTDDHLRNHGFLRYRSGWRLAPAFDLNPDPESAGRLATAIDLDDSTMDIDLVLSVSSFFAMTSNEARYIVKEIEDATRNWSTLASNLGLPADEISLMTHAFDSDARARAARLSTTAPPSICSVAHPAPHGQRSRHPAGTPRGGQFAPSRHPEASIELETD